MPSLLATSTDAFFSAGSENIFALMSVVIALSLGAPRREQETVKLMASSNARVTVLFLRMCPPRQQKQSGGLGVTRRSATAASKAGKHPLIKGCGRRPITLPHCILREALLKCNRALPGANNADKKKTGGARRAPPAVGKRLVGLG